LKELYREISLLTGNLLNFGQGQKLDVGVAPAFYELWGENAHGAVISGKGLVQLSHSTADGGRSLDEVDEESRFGKVESSLGPSYASSHNHDGARKVLCLTVVIHYFASP
jgi:hypothetical protein